VSITSSAGPPYTAGDQLSCAYNEGTKPEEDNPIYEWSGFNGGSLFSTTLNIVTLLDGEFCLLCTVTVAAVRTKEPAINCSGSAFVCGSAKGKYGKHAPDQTFTILLKDTCPLLNYKCKENLTA